MYLSSQSVQVGPWSNLYLIQAFLLLSLDQGWIHPWAGAFYRKSKQKPGAGEFSEQIRIFGSCLKDNHETSNWNSSFKWWPFCSKIKNVKTLTYSWRLLDMTEVIDRPLYKMALMSSYWFWQDRVTNNLHRGRIGWNTWAVFWNLQVSKIKNVKTLTYSWRLLDMTEVVDRCLYKLALMSSYWFWQDRVIMTSMASGLGEKLWTISDKFTALLLNKI